MSISVQEITRFYGEQKALDHVSFNVAKGEVLGFLGPNGAGKSTLMKIISCYLPQSSGTIKVCDFDVKDQPMDVKRKLGYLPEHNPLYPEMYVKEYLEFVASIYGLGSKTKIRCDEMMDLTGLHSEKKKKIGQLSKGYRQRVGLAQSLLHDPEVLILDEPTSGLDPNQLTEIRNLIKEIGKEKTVVLSTHIMQEVEAMCSRVVIINKGKIVANDPTSVLKAKTGKAIVVLVEFDKETKKSLLEAINGVSKVESVGSNKWKLSSASNEDVRNSIFHFAVAHQLTVLTLQQQEQNLEEIFRDLTN